MKRTLLILSLFLSVNCLFAQKPSAGADQTIYLTQTSTANLSGSGVGAPVWTDISSDFHGGTILNPTSLSTSVTGLKQGTFYYQLAVTNGGVTSKDTVVVRVEYDVPPLNSTLVRSFNMADPKNYRVFNNRGDTTSYFDLSNRQYSQTEDEKFYLFRGRSNGLMIDSSRGKLRSTNEDGYAGAKACDACAVYPRTEVQISNYDWLVDTSHTYVFEWKGYFPQVENYLNKDGHPDWATILTMFQIHGDAYDYAITNFSLNYNGNITFNNTVVDNAATGTGDFQPKDSLTIGFIPDFYNKSRTLRVTLKEGKGYPGQDAFIKMEMDGVQKYFRNTGGVGSPSFDDYVKFGGLYDWNSWITSRDSLARGRKYSLVTESFRIYQVPDPVVGNISVSMSANKTITTTSTGIAATATPDAGHTLSYSWTKVSGPSSYTIVSPGASATTVSNLTNGVYVFRCTVTQDDGKTGYGEVTVTVNIPNPPKANAGADKTITLPTNYVLLNGSAIYDAGRTVTYQWTKIIATGTYNITSPNAASTNISSLSPGSYSFELLVVQDDGQRSKDTVNVTVYNAPPPSAIAPDNLSVTSSSATLIGSGTAGAGTLSYSWRQTQGAAATITNANSSTATVSGLANGTYQFELTVRQTDGQTASHIVTVAVNIPNNPPVIDRPDDIIIYLIPKTFINN